MMEDIRALAAVKSFSELNEKEKSQVLDALPVDAYEQLHLLLRSARSLDANITPPAALAVRLQEHMAQRSTTAPKVHLIMRLLQQKIPVWQAAALFLLLLAAGRFLKTSTPLPVPPTALVQTVVKSDTVVLERITWKDRIVWREKSAPPHQSATAQLGVENPQENKTLPATIIHSAPGEVLVESAQKGTPIGEQPELFQFFTQPGESGKRF